MIRFCQFIALLICLFVSGLTYAQQAKTASVLIEINGIESSEGKIQVALFSNEATFPEGKPFKTLSKPTRSGSTLKVSFENIPYGTYAVAVYHDKNGNEALDTNFMGIPTEPYGFSNAHNPKFSGPDFNKAKVEIADSQINISVVLD